MQNSEKFSENHQRNLRSLRVPGLKNGELCLRKSSSEQVILSTDGDVEKTKRLYREMDDQVDAFGVGGAGLYLQLEGRDCPLQAALKLVEGVKSPCVDGRGLKHWLERRVFELAGSFLRSDLYFRQAFVPVAIDRLGQAKAVR